MAVVSGTPSTNRNASHGRPSTVVPASRMARDVRMGEARKDTPLLLKSIDDGGRPQVARANALRATFEIELGIEHRGAAECPSLVPPRPARVKVR